MGSWGGGGNSLDPHSPQLPCPIVTGYKVTKLLLSVDDEAGTPEDETVRKGAYEIAACSAGSVSYWTGETRTPADATACYNCEDDNDAVNKDKSNTYAPRTGASCAFLHQPGRLPRVLYWCKHKTKHKTSCPTPTPHLLQAWLSAWLARVAMRPMPLTPPASSAPSASSAASTPRGAALIGHGR